MTTTPIMVNLNGVDYTVKAPPPDVVPPPKNTIESGAADILRKAQADAEHQRLAVQRAEVERVATEQAAAAAAKAEEARLAKIGVEARSAQERARRATLGVGGQFLAGFAEVALPGAVGVSTFILTREILRNDETAPIVGPLVVGCAAGYTTHRLLAESLQPPPPAEKYSAVVEGYSPDNGITDFVASRPGLPLLHAPPPPGRELTRPLCGTRRTCMLAEPNTNDVVTCPDCRRRMAA